MLKILLLSFNDRHTIYAMTDGHTVAGSWPVTLDFTADQVEMLIRSIETATMISGSGRNSSDQPQNTMQMVAYREFLKDILGTLRQALDEQRP